MGVEFEAQSRRELQEIRTRELQQESVDQLNRVTDMVNDISFDGIESDTQEIKEMIINNLENQVDNDDLDKKIDKITQGITDIKRNQTNLTKRIKEIENKLGE